MVRIFRFFLSFFDIFSLCPTSVTEADSQGFARVRRILYRILDLLLFRETVVRILDTLYIFGVNVKES